MQDAFIGILMLCQGVLFGNSNPIRQETGPAASGPIHDCLSVCPCELAAKQQRLLILHN